jgi:hypothetical protein
MPIESWTRLRRRVLSDCLAGKFPRPTSQITRIETAGTLRAILELAANGSLPKQTKGSGGTCSVDSRQAENQAASKAATRDLPFSDSEAQARQPRVVDCRVKRTDLS